ncbi:hypothetical protein NPIL_196271 [Nephila pilipes]|uniref:Uncharacterized protein n=1 Tax=Nephila pilipes TaxID=299642 RepID=A0A8X6Q3U8_NEPPI|nr:hypothetical protein NPIL_196271 [Nephila pilipes]
MYKSPYQYLVTRPFLPYRDTLLTMPFTAGIIRKKTPGAPGCLLFQPESWKTKLILENMDLTPYILCSKGSLLFEIRYGKSNLKLI